MSNSGIWDSVNSVWSWTSETSRDQIRKILHANCDHKNQFVQTVDSGVEKLNAVQEIIPEMPVSSFVRIAGLSGALAVSLGAYGAHVIGQDPDKAQLRHTFDTANKYHLIHSVALLAVPLARMPRLSGSLFVGGMLVFCGTTYYHALTENTQVRKFTPYGGIMLILAWLSLIL